MPGRPLAALIAASIAFASCSLAWACSGPGAAETIARAERTGWWLLLVTVALAAGAMVLARAGRVARARWAWIAAVVVVHPGWWMSARGGDCGAMRILGSTAVTVAAGVVAVIAGVIVWRRRGGAAAARR